MQYKALTNLHHDGIVYAAGDLLDMPEEQATPLIELQVIEENFKPFAEQKPTHESPTP